VIAEVAEAWRVRFRLTGAELDVLLLRATELDDFRGIAERRSSKPDTVKKQAHAICRKVSAPSLADAALRLFREAQK
jgi:hypothetical protein